MKVDLLIINAKELLTIAGSDNPRTRSEMNELGIINNGALAIKDNKIIDVGSTEGLINKFDAPSKIIDATDKVVMPGFVDPHTHPVFKQTRENEFEMRINGKS